MMEQATAKHLFADIENMLQKQISKEQTEKMVTEIIDILKKNQLTYDQAYGILDTARTTLTAMSYSVAL